MCYHRDHLAWAARREAPLEATEATDEDEAVEEPEPLAPAADD